MRKLTALALVIILLIGMAFSAAAMTIPQRIQSFDDAFAQKLSLMELDGEPLAPDALQDLEVYAGSELRIYLVAKNGDSLFLDQNGAIIPSADITQARLRAASVSVKHHQGMNGVVESADLAYSAKTEFLPCAAPYIQVVFASDFESINDSTFDFDLTLDIAGVPQDHTTTSVAGILRIRETDLYNDGLPIDLSGGNIALARENIPQANLELGVGVTMQADLRSGERYYGVAQVEERQMEDGRWEFAYQLETTNFDHPSTTVRIQSDTTLFVYDANGNLLGTTRDALPYSNEYILTNQNK